MSSSDNIEMNVFQWIIESDFKGLLVTIILTESPRSWEELSKMHRTRQVTNLLPLTPLSNTGQCCHNADNNGINLPLCRYQSPWILRNKMNVDKRQTQLTISCYFDLNNMFMGKNWEEKIIVYFLFFLIYLQEAGSNKSIQKFET